MNRQTKKLDTVLPAMSETLTPLFVLLQIGGTTQWRPFPY